MSDVRKLQRHLCRGKNYKTGKQLEADFELLFSEGSKLYFTALESKDYSTQTLYFDDHLRDHRFVFDFNKLKSKDAVGVSYSALTGYCANTDTWKGTIYNKFYMETWFDKVPSEVFRFLFLRGIMYTQGINMLYISGNSSVQGNGKLIESL